MKAGKVWEEVAPALWGMALGWVIVMASIGAVASGVVSKDPEILQCVAERRSE